jgi:hypothetical protein
VHSIFCEFIVNSNTVVSFHHTTIVRRLEDDETERQRKCKLNVTIFRNNVRASSSSI